MADRHRERVGGVVGPRLGGEPEQRLHHPRDLLLPGAPAAAHRALDLLRRVAGARHAALAGGEHHHPARLPDRERAAGVLAEVQLLERDRVRLVLAQQRLHARVDVGEPPLGRRARGRRDDAAVERREPPARAADDDAVAGVGEARGLCR